MTPICRLLFQLDQFILKLAFLNALLREYRRPIYERHYLLVKDACLKYGRLYPEINCSKLLSELYTLTRKEEQMALLTYGGIEYVQKLQSDRRKIYDEMLHRFKSAESSCSMEKDAAMFDAAASCSVFMAQQLLLSSQQIGWAIIGGFKHVLKGEFEQAIDVFEGLNVAVLISIEDIESALASQSPPPS